MGPRRSGTGVPVSDPVVGILLGIFIGGVLPVVAFGSLFLLAVAFVGKLNRKFDRENKPEGMRVVYCRRCSARQQIPELQQDFECWRCHEKGPSA